MNRPSNQPHDPRRSASRRTDREEFPPIEELGFAGFCIGSLFLFLLAVVALALRALGIFDPFS